jgi:hypothetical protein
MPKNKTPINNEAELKRRLGRLSRKSLEYIAFSAFCGLYQDIDENLFFINADKEVSGADYVEDMANTLAHHGLSPEVPT